MRVDEYETRHETILKLDLPVVEKNKMLLGLLSDIERASKMPIPKNEALEQENEKLNSLYRKVLKSFL